MICRRTFFAGIACAFLPKLSQAELPQLDVGGDGDKFLLQLRGQPPKNTYLEVVHWEQVCDNGRDLWRMRFHFSDSRFFDVTTPRFDFWWGNLLWKDPAEVEKIVRANYSPDMRISAWST